MESRELGKKPDKAEERFLQAILKGDLQTISNPEYAGMINTMFKINCRNHGDTRRLSPVTPLYYSVFTTQWSVTKRLLELGANPAIASYPNGGDAPAFPHQLFLYAMQNGNLKTHLMLGSIDRTQLNSLLTLFLEKGADFTRYREATNLLLLCNLATYINVGFFAQLLKKMGKETFTTHINTPPLTEDRRTSKNLPLHMICEKGLNLHANFLLRNGADPFVTAGDASTYPITICMRNLTFLKEKQIEIDESPEVAARVKIVEEEYISTTNLLLNAMADRIKDRPEILHQAVFFQNIPVIRFMLGHGADVNTRNSDGYTPAHLAAAFGDLDTLRILVEEFNCDLTLTVNVTKIDVSKKLTEHSLKFTPTKEAKKQRKQKTPQISGQENRSSEFITLPTTTPPTAIIIALLSGRQNTFEYLYAKSSEDEKSAIKAIIPFVFEQGNDRLKELIENIPELKEMKHQNMPLDALTEANIIELIIAEKTALAVSQLQAIHKKNVNLKHLLSVAIEFNNIEVTKCLLSEHHEETVSLLKSNFLYVNLAITFFADKALLKLLLENNAKTRDDNSESTSMHVATLWENIEAIQVLAEHDRALLDESSNEISPLFFAAKEDKDDAAKYLLELGANCLKEKTTGVNPLLALIANNKLALTRQALDLLAAQQIEPFSKNKANTPYLHAAFRTRNIALLILLFERGARDTSYFETEKNITWIRSAKIPSELKSWIDEQYQKVNNAEPKEKQQLDYPTISSSGMSGRKYLATEHGDFSTSDESDEEIKSPIANLGLFSTTEPLENFTWFGLLSSSEIERVVKIQKGVNCYLYLDTKRLLDQGCTNALIEEAYTAPKFDGIKIKTLSHISLSCHIRLNSETCQASLHSELRIANSPHRILLWEVKDPTGRGTLLIGCDYLDDGLHKNRHIRDLMRRVKTTNLIELSHNGVTKGVKCQH